MFVVSLAWVEMDVEPQTVKKNPDYVIAITAPLYWKYS